MEETTTEVASEQTEMVVESGEGEVQTTSYVDGKFTSVGDLENSYRELESSYSKKLGGFEGSPESYDFGEAELSDGDKGMRDMLSGWGAENQLSQSGFEGLVGKYNEYQEGVRNAGIDQAMVDLGDNAEGRLTAARDFLNANLGEDATKALAANMNTAGSIEAIEKLISLTKGVTPAPNQIADGSFASKEKLEALRFALDDNGQRKMSIDPEYRKMVLKEEARARA